MQSLRELYRIGPGPSSSHTLAIQRACLHFIECYPEEMVCRADLYGSLSLTGKGHMTDVIIRQTFEAAGKTITVRFMDDWNIKHPNTMVIEGESGVKMTIYSIGGGAFTVEGEDNRVDAYVYPQSSMKEILALIEGNGWTLYDYTVFYEPDLPSFLKTILHQMLKTVDAGLQQQGILPGSLKLPRVAKQIMQKAMQVSDSYEQKRLELTAYAYACAEENASGHTVVTAPTLGSCGVLPAIMQYYYAHGLADEDKLVASLAVAGIFGNLIKTNATLSGAEGGCQAEIGTACAMAAAACSYLEDLSTRQICYAAECGMEHHLGLTCDPVGGYVMIPCIERNGAAALRSVDAMLYAKHIGAIKENRVSFDMVVQSMNYTGKKLPIELKETSLGGLALVYPLQDDKQG